MKTNRTNDQMIQVNKEKRQWTNDKHITTKTETVKPQQKTKHVDMHENTAET